MTDVVAIEFCQANFTTKEACETWLKQSIYFDLLRVKGFSLRKGSQAKILTTEKKRKTWHWNRGLGSYQTLEIQRPLSVIAVVVKRGDMFPPCDLPAPLPSTVEYEREKEEKLQKRNEARKQKRKDMGLDETPKKKKPRAKKPKVKKDPIGLDLGVDVVQCQLNA